MEIMIANINDNIRGIFDYAVSRIKVNPEVIHGIDEGRKSFVALFKTEEAFQHEPEVKQKAFFLALEHAMEQAILSDDTDIANGISLFMLWTMATVANDESTKDWIEQSFSDFRQQNNIH